MKFLCKCNDYYWIEVYIGISMLKYSSLAKKKQKKQC